VSPPTTVSTTSTTASAAAATSSSFAFLSSAQSAAPSPPRGPSNTRRTAPSRDFELPPPPPPVYAATIRPLPSSQLKGRRVLPLLDHCHGTPFLRLGRPQSHALSNILRSKARRRQRRVAALLGLEDRGAAQVAAAREDEWEDLVDGLIGSRSGGGGGSGSGSGWKVVVDGDDYYDDDADDEVDGESTFSDGVAVAARDLLERLNTERIDMMARAHAMLQIVRDERELAEREEAEKTAEKGRPGEQEQEQGSGLGEEAKK
jgi:hypothetical protein